MGCYNKTAQTGQLKNIRHLFLTVLEAGKSKIKVPADLVSGEGLPPGSKTAVFLLYPFMTEGVKELSGVSSKRALIPIVGLHPHVLLTAQRAHLLIPSYGRLGFQHMNFEGTWQFSPLQMS